MRIRPMLLLLAGLSLAPVLPVQAGNEDPQITRDLSQLICQRIKAGDRFDVGMFRAMAELVARNEAFALMIAGNQESQVMEKVGEQAVALCPTEAIASFEKMPPRLRKAYGL